MHGRRLLVVEDEPLTASLMAAALEGYGFVVETAPDVVTARCAVESFDPDAALIDVSLGAGPSGLDLAFSLSKQRPDIALLILTKHSDLRGRGFDTVPAKCGFLRKDRINDPGYLLQQLELVFGDEEQAVRHDLSAPSPLAGLSAQQVNILRLMAMGYTNEGIAQHTNSSLSSVERWVIQVFRGLGLETRGELNPRVEAVRIFGMSAGIPERP